MPQKLDQNVEVRNCNCRSAHAFPTRHLLPQIFVLLDMCLCVTFMSKFLQVSDFEYFPDLESATSFFMYLFLVCVMWMFVGENFLLSNYVEVSCMNSVAKPLVGYRIPDTGIF